MSYTYCSNCHDSICVCGEKYQGMSSSELTELITMLTHLRDKHVARENMVADPVAMAKWRREQQLQHREQFSNHPTRRR